MPFAEQNGGVVVQTAVVMVEDGVCQTAQGLGDGQTVGVVADEEVGEAPQAEQFAVASRASVMPSVMNSSRSPGSS